MNEEWRPIEGTDGMYEVSNLGRVRTNGKRPGLLTLTRQKTGYRYAMIQLTSGKQRNCRVHRLVAEYFVPNPDGLPEVNHRDGDKDNNRADNLEWCTRSHNVKHSFDTGLKHPHRWTADERQHIADKVKATIKRKRNS
ncbi:MAG: NUMOD4 motif-containing HNH endonuclease [Prevotella sp.]|nr:NUMOD4 motif-containing HNH endonuclease [Prevotella sp.]